MGKGRRKRPRLLGRKMRKIREALGLSQNEVLRHLGLDEEFTRAEISAYERGVREPPSKILLKYSAAVRVWVNVLIDDDLNLPSLLPAKAMHAGVKRARTKSR
jgi:transcriptional regulator with XRE-family HTH domain